MTGAVATQPGAGTAPLLRIKVLSLGDPRTGKSCLIKRFCEERFIATYFDTIGIDYGVKQVQVQVQPPASLRGAAEGAPPASEAAVANAFRACLVQRMAEEPAVSEQVSLPVRVNFWDVSGEPFYRNVRNEFYTDTQGMLLVYDVTNAESFHHLEQWLEESGAGGAVARPAAARRSVAGAAMPPGGVVAVVVCANMVDLCSDDPTANRVAKKRAVSEAEGRAWADRHGFAYFECSASSGLNVEALMHHLFRRVVENQVGP